VVASVGEIEEAVTRLRKMGATRTQFMDLFARWEEAKDTVTRLEGVEDIVVPDLKQVTEDVESVEALHPLYRDLTIATESVTRLGGVDSIDVPDIKEVEVTVGKISSLRDLHRSLAAAQGWAWRLEGIEEIDVEVDTTKADKMAKAIVKLRDFADRLGGAVEERRLVALELQQLEEEHTEVVKAIDRTLGDLTECPVCGAVTEAPHEHEAS
jgi:hypothetical protein